MSFEKRLKKDRQLKEIFFELISKFGRGTLHITEIGQENFLKQIHEHIRYKRDITTEFLRYFPDIFVCYDKSLFRESWIVELKVATTGFVYDNATPLLEMRRFVSDLKKEEIVNIELGSWENLVRIAELGVNIVVWAYVSYHLESSWLAIVPDKDLNLRNYLAHEMRFTRGSGTPIANIFVRVDNSKVFRLEDWLEKKFGFPRAEVLYFLREKEFLLTGADIHEGNIPEP